MKKISSTLVREILAQHLDHERGPREIARLIHGVSVATASRKISEFKLSGLNWAELRELSDEEFEQRITPRTSPYLELPYEDIRKFLGGHRKRTLEMAYEQCYRSRQAAEGLVHYKYTRFCELYTAWLRSHTGYHAITAIPCEPGDYIEIDFSGDLLKWRDFEGAGHRSHVFVAALRYSKLMFAEAFENEKVESWLKGTVDALAYFGGSPRALVCDNARALVSKPDPYLGQISAALAELCEHYQMVGHTCRIKSPKFKQTAEYSANLAQTAQAELAGTNGLMLAKDLAAVNAALIQQVEKRNQANFTTGAEGSRRSCFENEEKATLRPLPIVPYEVCHWTTLTANSRYLVTVDHQAYMVHYSQAGKRVAARVSPTEVRFFRLGDHQQVGCYRRAYGAYSVHSDLNCMSPADRALRRGYEGVAENFIARGYGQEHILLFLKTLYANETLPAMSKRNIAGAFKKLCDRHGATRLEEICAWAARHDCLHQYQRLRERLQIVLRGDRPAAAGKGGAQ